jgi:hypothetical protein
MIRVWQLPRPSAAFVAEGLDRLARVVEGTARDAVDALRWCVPEYRPGSGNASGAASDTSSAKPHMRLVDAPADGSVAA